MLVEEDWDACRPVAGNTLLCAVLSGIVIPRGVKPRQSSARNQHHHILEDYGILNFVDSAEQRDKRSFGTQKMEARR